MNGIHNMKNPKCLEIIVTLAAVIVLIGSQSLAGGQPVQQKSKPAAAQSASAPKLDAELIQAMQKAPKAADFPNRDYARLFDIATVTIQLDGTIVTTTRETSKLFN